MLLYFNADDRLYIVRMFRKVKKSSSDMEVPIDAVLPSTFVEELDKRKQVETKQSSLGAASRCASQLAQANRDRRMP